MDGGADGLTLVNTVPGLLLLPDSGDPELGAGSGGVSGPALLPIGLRAVEEARKHTSLPLLGVGGVLTPTDAVAYARAGATLVQLGTASFADPRAGLRLARGLARWGRRKGIGAWGDLVAPAPTDVAAHG
jgi:dihydroorotate dehydrogenase (NAD+) catalytic subunit